MKGWAYQKISEIGKVQTGSTPQTTNKANYGDYIPFIKPGDFLKNGSLNYKNQGLSKQGLKSARLIEKDSVLMVCIGATIGKVGIAEQEVVTNQQINALTPLHGHSAKFIFYQMLTKDFQQKVLNGAGQATLPIINKKKWSDLSLHLPHPLEQKRIAAILDEAFEGIDRTIANTEKNLTNARELFESYLNSIFTQKGDGWTEKRLGDVATFRNGLNFTKGSKGQSIKIVGVKDFQNNFWLQEEKLESVTIDGALKEIDVLRKGDILTVRSNGNRELIGRCVLVGNLSEKTSHSGFTIRIRIEEENIYLPFVVHFLKCKALRKQLAESGGGISISSLNQQGLSLITLSFPPFVEQKTIVENIDELAVETQRLEAIYQQKLAALNELKQSILQKAFTGELTANMPHQATETAKEVVAA